MVPAAPGQQHDLFRMLDRQQPQDQLIDQREDGRIGADPQGQRQDRHQAEDRRLPEAADGEQDVLQKLGHAWPSMVIRWLYDAYTARARKSYENSRDFL